MPEFDYALAFGYAEVFVQEGEAYAVCYGVFFEDVPLLLAALALLTFDEGVEVSG